MKKLVLVLAIVAFGCSSFETKHAGETYRYEWSPEHWSQAWEQVALEISEAQDECIQGKRMDCFGDPAGGGVGAGGASGGGAGGSGGGGK